MDTLRAGKSIQKMKEISRERKGLFGFEAGRVSRVEVTDNGCRDKEKDLGKGAGMDRFPERNALA